MNWAKWVNVIAGGVLILAPFVFGYNGTPAELWTSLIMGVVIAVLGFVEAYKWLTLAGLVTLVAPFVLRFSGIGAALQTCVLMGVLVANLNVCQCFFSEGAKSGSAQHRHA
jgi:hypothetical protein